MNIVKCVFKDGIQEVRGSIPLVSTNFKTSSHADQNSAWLFLFLKQIKRIYRNYNKTAVEVEIPRLLIIS